MTVESMDDVIGAQSAQERAWFSLLAVFAAIAVMLACIGTCGMMAYSVSARSRDVGIRMALGATASRCSCTKASWSSRWAA